MLRLSLRLAVGLCSLMGGVAFADGSGFERSPQSKSDTELYLQSAVRNTITKRQSEIQICYKNFVKKAAKSAKTDGKISIDWQISGVGKVISPEVVNDEIADKGFSKCMTDTIKKWKFPDPPTSRNVYVNHHFHFKKDTEEAAGAKSAK